MVTSGSNGSPTTAASAQRVHAAVAAAAQRRPGQPGALERGGRHPNTIKAFHVFGWFIYDMTYGITTVQCVGVGLWTILNKKQKIFPGWAGWATILVGTCFVTLVVLPWVPGGPLAVSGIWNFFVIFGTWLFLFFGLYSYFMIKEMSRRRNAEITIDEPSPTPVLS